MPVNFPIQLPCDFVMPAIGLGTYLVSDHEVEVLVYQALVMGYRHIDTAQGYHNEAGVGRAIQQYLKLGSVNREHIFITSKLWPGNADWGQIPKNYDTSLLAFEESLERLQLDYLDLYLIHAPFKKQQRIAQWRALMHLKETGRVRHIGVSNFNQRHIEELIDVGLSAPDVNQIELHPWSQKQGLVSYLKLNNILPMAYSSLVPLANWRTEPRLESAKTQDMVRYSQDNNNVFIQIANKHQVSQAQLLLRWALELGYAVIPKSLKTEHLAENLKLYHFKLDDEDRQRLNALDLDESVSWPNGDPSKVE